MFALFAAMILLAAGLLQVSGTGPPSPVRADLLSQVGNQSHRSFFRAGPGFNVRSVTYEESHDFDPGTGIDNCLSLSVPPGDTFTLSLEWQSAVPVSPDEGDLDLYIYLDAACTESQLLTSSFNSNAYTGELIEISPRVRNVGDAAAVAGIRIGKRKFGGEPGLLHLSVLTGDASFLEHGTDGPPLAGQNSPTPTPVPTVTVGAESVPDSTAVPSPSPEPTPSISASPEAGGTDEPGSPAPPQQSGGAGFAPPPVFEAPVENVSRPSAPRFVRAEAGDGSVDFTWQRPLSDGGAPIDGYRIFNVNTAHGTIVLGDVQEATLNGLANGTSYLFQVMAFNSAGFGDGALVGPVTPVSDDPEPLEVNATLLPDDSVTLWWNTPETEEPSTVVLYRVWTEEGELLQTLDPGTPPIVNLRDLASDTEYVFRVTATDADGKLVAVGTTQPVLLPPILASSYEPLPSGAIVVPLTDQSLLMLRDELTAASGNEVGIPEASLVVVASDGVARAFMATTGMHRAVQLPVGLVLDSGQIQVVVISDLSTELAVEIAHGVSLAGKGAVQIDRSGIEFRLSPVSLAILTESITQGPVTTFSAVSPLLTLDSEFAVQASENEATPELQELLSANDRTEIVGMFEVQKAGVIGDNQSPEDVVVRLDQEWFSGVSLQGAELRLTRIGEAGITGEASFNCVINAELVDAVCRATLQSGHIGKSLYAVTVNLEHINESPTPIPTSTPEPVSAPSDPTPVSGPSLVVVDAAAPTVLPEPTPTASPTPAAGAGGQPELPESGGNAANVVTWLMSGVLGLVLLRGAFYAAGRLKA